MINHKDSFKIYKTQIVFAILALAFLPLIGFSQKSDEIISLPLGEVNTSTGVNCFDYYKFPSIEITLQPEKLTYQPGEKVVFRGNLKNENSYPIVQGNLLIQVFRQNPQDSLTYGDFLVDEFVALENVYLNPLGEKKVVFVWKIPEGLSPGKYFLGAHFQVAKKLNLAGLSFIEGVYGGITNFEIKSDKEVSEVMIEKSKVLINNQNFYARSFVPQFDAGQPIKIDFPLKNLSDKEQRVQLSKRLFLWDNLLLERLLKEEKEEIEIGPLASKPLSAFFEKLSPGVYLYEIIAQSQETKSILKVRFAINGENPPARLNFVGLSNFPIKKGQNGYIFSCFHSVTDRNNFEGKVVLNLKDKEGNLIAQSEYQGLITPQIMAIKKDFLSDKDYDELILESFVYDENGKVVDQISLNYNCSQFNEPKDISLKTENGVINVVPLNICGQKIAMQMAIEITDEKGKTILFEPSFFGQEFRRELPLKEGKNYKISILSSGIEKEETISYAGMPKPELPKKMPVVFLLLILALVLIFFFVLNIIKSKKKIKNKKA